MENLTTKEFKEFLKEKYPNLTLLEEYINKSTKILFIDNLGIKYKVNPGSLLRGETPRVNSSIDKTDWFTRQANNKHNNFYTYSKTIYIKAKEKVIITCPVHGDFLQTPVTHLQGQGCNKCAVERTAKLNTMSLDTFLDKAHKKHDSKYTYDNTTFKGSSSKVDVICSIHGKFSIAAYSHLYGKGCPKCGKRTTLKTFVKRANKIHNNKYTYNDLVFRDSNSKIKIICPIHGEFKQTVYTHLLGHGCQKCGLEINPSWTRTKWIEFCNKKKNADPKVYIIRCFNENENFVKIGITSNSVYKRFLSNLPYEYEILKEIKGSPAFIYDKEIELHRKCKKHTYTPLISFIGKTECFTLDSLQLLNIN